MESHVVYDLDSQSEAASEEEVDDSASSWQIEDAESWHMQDGCSSTKSFNLCYEVVDDDAGSDASSNCSFMMVTSGSISGANLRHKQQQQLQQQQQQSDAAADAATAETAATEDAATEAAAHPAVEPPLPMTSGMQVIAPPPQLPPPWPIPSTMKGKTITRKFGEGQSGVILRAPPPECAVRDLGSWQEQQELDLAIALSLAMPHSNDAEDAACSSSNSSAASSNSSAATPLSD